MAVRLRREPIGGNSVRVLVLPEWARGAKGEYWHVPRSAAIYDGDRLCVSAWCGPSFNYPQLTDDPPADLRCGTCVGRRDGTARTDGLIFTPRDHFALPVRCPGESDGRTCTACGGRVRYSWLRGTSVHRPAPELAVRCRPCPRHGWVSVQSHSDRGERLYCVAHEPDGLCRYDCGPYTTDSGNPG